MRVRARTNGNVVDLPDTQAQGLIDAGIYDAVDVEEDVGQASDESDPSDDSPQRRRRRLP